MRLMPYGHLSGVELPLCIDEDENYVWVRHNKNTVSLFVLAKLVSSGDMMILKGRVYERSDSFTKRTGWGILPKRP